LNCTCDSGVEKSSAYRSSGSANDQARAEFHADFGNQLVATFGQWREDYQAELRKRGLQAHEHIPHLPPQLRDVASHQVAMTCHADHQLYRSVVDYRSSVRHHNAI